MNSNMSTPIDSFINHKVDTGMQCGNYSIEIPELKDIEYPLEEYDRIDLAELVMERERIASHMSEEDILRHMITNFLRNEDLLLTERLEIIQTAIINPDIVIDTVVSEYDNGRLDLMEFIFLIEGIIDGVSYLTHR